MNEDATTWVSNLTQNGTDTPISNHVSNVPEGIRNESELRSVLSPLKPVNLLPQVPINSNSYRKLSENEEHDCEIIGNKLYCTLFFNLGRAFILYIIWICVYPTG